MRFVIALPAWGRHYVDYAVRYAVPSLLAALRHTPPSGDVQFVVFTDDAPAMGGALAGHDVDLRGVPDGTTEHGKLTAAHAAVLAEAPIGTAVIPWNADLVVSRELFASAETILTRGFQVMASCGIRTTLTGDEPPIGADAATLLTWAWRARHPVVDECIWGKGRTAFPVTLFFESGDDVVLHCSHLHPFAILKDQRNFEFRGTVDDGLLVRFSPDEVFYMNNAEIGFAEISPPGLLAQHFTAKRDRVIDAAAVVEFGRHFMPAHVRNLRQPLRIKGVGPVDDSVIAAIADRMRPHD